MLQSPGDGDGAISGFNEVSSPEAQSAGQRLLTKILSDGVAGLSSSDKARALIAAHGDLQGVLRTESHRLMGVVPLSDEELSLLEIMRRAVGFASDDSLSKPTIGSLSALEGYLRGSSERDASLLLLDQRNRLQADIAFSTAVGQHQLPAARDVIRLALEHGASAAIAVQSRRGALTMLEPALINQAKIVERSLRIVGVILQDFVLRSDHRCVSMRACGLICCAE
jgi:DNA repair protein RadC